MPNAQGPISSPTPLRFASALALMGALLLGACATQRAAMPPLVEVPDWGGQAAMAEAPAQHISHITLHHQGEHWQEGRDVADYLRRLQQWSRLSKRWADIPYHYVIAPDGRIYSARPLALAGDTNTEYRPEGHALVMLLGNFEEQRPSAAQLRATVALMAGLAVQHGLKADSIASHKDYSARTVCPGRHLYAYLESGWLQRAVAQRLEAPLAEISLPPDVPVPADPAGAPHSPAPRSSP